MLALVALSSLCASNVRAYCRLTTEAPDPYQPCSNHGIGLTWQRQCISFSMSQRAHDTPTLDATRNVRDVSFATWKAVSCNNHPVGLSIRQTAALGSCSKPEYNTHAPNAN